MSSAMYVLSMLIIWGADNKPVGNQCFASAACQAGYASAD